MCGIAGIMRRDGAAPDQETLEQLSAALRHRGPDGGGDYRDGATALTHTRLAIIDLETGDQPLHRGQLTLIGNGEIYNYRELRDQIGVATFATNSDCEPPLALYAAEGANFPHNLRGMYALAIVDGEDGRVVISRDPFGIKPLYLAETVEGVAFASEPQAFFNAGWCKPNLNGQSRDQLLQLQFTTGTETVFEGVRRVLPGETITLSAGRVESRQRLPALPVVGPENWSEDEALSRLDQALRESVAMHQRSDVPYGMFLSGGIDSSAILACMRDLNDRPVQAFTAGFSDTSVADERAQAEVIAAAAGADFHAVDFSEVDFWNLLPEIVGHFDDPVADYAILPTFKLAASAKEQGLKVVLSGEGGDEMFAGYGRYRRQMRPRLLGGRPMRSRGIFDQLGILRSQDKVWREGLSAAAADEAVPGRTRLQIAQATDCADWLPHDLLLKLDRCLMAHSVEGRTPFLDPVVAQLAMRLPDRLKVRRGVGKWLLRQWLSKALPEAQPFAPKRGFTVPVAEWIGRRGKALGECVAAQSSIAEIASPEAVKELFRSLEGTARRGAGQAAWVLLFYALWHRRHIVGKPETGDVFETLAETV